MLPRGTAKDEPERQGQAVEREFVPLTRVDHAFGIALAVLVFFTCSMLTHAFDRHQTFDTWNVIFDADANTRLAAFTDGWTSHGRNLAHPNLANFVNPPIRVIAAIGARVVPGSQDARTWRRELALGVAPLALGLSAWIARAFFRSSGASRAASAVLALLATTTFAGLVFGSIPDHFALSGLGLAATFMAAFALGPVPSRRATLVLTAIGVFAMGVTVTNLLPFALILAGGRRRKGASWRVAGLESVRVVCLVLIVSGLSFAIMSSLYRSVPDPQFDAQWVEDHWQEGSPWMRLEQAPAALTASFAPPELAIRDNRLARETRGPLEFRFSLLGTPAPGARDHRRGVIPLLAIALGIITGWRAGGAWRVTIGTALCVLGFNLLLHALWGSEYFLYAMHWHFALVVLVSGVLARGEGRFRWRLAALAVLLLVSWSSSAQTIAQMLDTLAAS